MEKLPKLFSRDSNGKILEWRIVIVDEEDKGIILTVYGEYKGKLVTGRREVLEGKNTGKANATTPYTQAIKEATSDWNHKRKTGYKSLDDLKIKIVGNTFYYNGEEINTDFETLLDMALPTTKTDSKGNVKIMKCQPFRRGKFKYPCWAQPKINGCRVWASEEDNKNIDIFNTKDKERVLRRKEGDLCKLPHLIPHLEKLPNLPYDGEGYVQGEEVTNISGAAINPSNPINPKMMLWIFDLAIPNETQDYRIDLLTTLAQSPLPIAYVDKVDGSNNHLELNVKDTPIVIVNSVMLFNDDEVEDYRTKCILAGYEGCVIRDRKAIYRFGSRPVTMMKAKAHIDAEFKVIDIVAQEARPDMPMFVLQNDVDNQQFESTPTGSFDIQRNVLLNKHKYIGKLVTVRYRERIARKPFHTNVIRY